MFYGNILLFFSRNFFLLTLLPHFHLLKTSKSYRNLLTHTQCSAQNQLILFSVLFSLNVFLVKAASKHRK